MKIKPKNTLSYFLRYALPFLVVFAMFLFATLPAFAQELPQLVTCSGGACKWCDVFALLQRVFNTAEVIVFPLVVIYIIYGATLYIISATSGSEEGINKARATVTDAIIGLVLVLLTFVIVNATITGITGGKIENFVSLDCSVVDTGTGDFVIKPPPPPPSEDSLPGPIAQGSATEDGVRNLMKNAKPPISVNHGKCPDATHRYEDCTNLAGMRGDTINGILQVNQLCAASNGGKSCNLMINGGTELDHHEVDGQSHPAGYKVDFDRPNAALDNYIMHYCPGGKNCSYGVRDDNATLYRGPGGSIWANEGGHWDITFP